MSFLQTVTSFVFLVAITQVDKTYSSSCTDEQVRKCKKAALYGKMGGLPGGGVCTQKQYVHYTHICRVNNFGPNIDYCCCVLDKKALCCRYHQNWDTFRCAEPEDAIEDISHRGLPLKILLPAILGPVVLLSCCAICCVCRYVKWASQKNKRRKEESQSVPAMHPTTMGHQIGLVSEMEPLNHSPVGGVDEWKRIPPDGIPDRTHLEPSAPPEDHMSSLPPYSVGNNIPPVPSYNNNDDHANGQNNNGHGNGQCSGHRNQDIIRQDSVISNSSSSQYGSNANTPAGSNPAPGAACPTCPNCSGSACAPPAYEESLMHPIMHHEESLPHPLVSTHH